MLFPVSGFLLLALTIADSALADGTATIDPTRTYQTIEGLGGAVAFYDG